jgi:predicted Fe-S protein YdhL (DUF1289 family)
MTLRLDGSVSNLADSPCTGVCSTTQFGHKRCKGCGRYDFEIVSSYWSELTELERKLINLRNAAQGFKIRHLR